MSEAQTTEAEQRQFPVGDSVDRALGWKLDYWVLTQTKDLASEDEHVSLEAVEAVVMALAKLGYVVIDR